MREVAFIKQNKEKWLEFERAIFDNDFEIYVFCCLDYFLTSSGHILKSC